MADKQTLALFWGEDDYLMRRAARDFLEAAAVKATEVEAADWQGGETSDVATPSLWGERRALLVTGCESLPESGVRELRSYLESPSPDAVCVLTLVSRAKNPPALARAVEAGGGLVSHVILRRQDVVNWVVGRGRAKGVQISGAGAAALVEAVGEDTALLDQSVEQLATAFTGKTVGREEVRAQFRGSGEQRIWDLCDRAFSGRLADALVVLRGLLAGREEPLLILGGVASRLRDLVRVKALPERMPAAEAARAAGLRFEWQVRRYREEAKRLSLEEMRALHDQVVESDRALKAGVAGDVVLAALIAAVAGHRISLGFPRSAGR